MGVLKVFWTERYLAVSYFWEIFYMRGEFLDLNVFVRKFYINKSLCFLCIFWV
ncbi:hypothetical protein VCRA2123O444_440009 [Vibrio crassostreae]|nr:hypothetical protein VCHA52P456_150020 [Vibrio chagasii]CAK1953450.1 hypothetical protein VCRA2118O429_270048 [Vibrio crassostreae]CAK1954688.1 hypothetical protein VCRA2119O432_280020 [Vibrio crassostreae]CAK1956379.1 hypothetical protein VCRA2113O413_280020 [Vibrio crassostreae]CAK1959065.1 hypothetical protein VCRA2114O423_280049 [Vibrio crassostreae]